MSGHEEIRALAQLREGFRDAARREIARPRRTPLRMRRGAMVMVGALLALAGVAGGASLLSTGESVRPGVLTGRYVPTASDAPPIAVVAGDAAGDARWGVATYTATGGDDCAIVGQVQGGRLGQITDGVFHPYAPDATGVCGKASEGRPVGDLRYTADPVRTLVYGPATADVRRVVLTVDGERYEADARGAFLFVFEGRVKLSDLRLDVG